MRKDKVKDSEDDLIVVEVSESDEEGEGEDLIGSESFNIPLNGSPLYPRVFVGDSAKPLMGQFPESEYVDDNITRMWTGLLNGFFG